MIIHFTTGARSLHPSGTGIYQTPIGSECSRVACGFSVVP